MSNELDAWPGGVTATLNVTYTQANAAGGAVVCEISPGSGNEFILMQVRGVNSGTHGIDLTLETATGGTTISVLQSVASGAGTNMSLSVGTIDNVLTTGNVAGLGYPLIVSGNQALKITNTGAGAQNDTFTILCNVRCKGAVPTAIHSNSTNPANVSVTAGAESFTTV